MSCKAVIELYHSCKTTTTFQDLVRVISGMSLALSSGTVTHFSYADQKLLSFLNCLTPVLTSVASIRMPIRRTVVEINRNHNKGINNNILCGMTYGSVPRMSAACPVSVPTLQSTVRVNRSTSVAYSPS